MKKLFQKGKRFLALTLAAALSLSGLPAVGGMQAKASTELTEENIDRNNGGTVSAYEWRGSNFNVEGISNPALIGSANPYTGSGVKATFANGGYDTYFKVGGDDSTTDARQYNTTNNGGVMPGNPSSSRAVDKLELKMKVYPSKDEKLIIVEYSVYNPTSAPITDIKFGSGADVMISTHDAAPIQRFANSIKMVNAYPGDTVHNGDTFELVMKDPSYGINNEWITAGGEFKAWMGIYHSRYYHQFEHFATGYFNGGDSELTYSWKIASLGAYQRAVRKVGFKPEVLQYM